MGLIIWIFQDFRMKGTAFIFFYFIFFISFFLLFLPQAKKLGILEVQKGPHDSNEHSFLSKAFLFFFF